ncbi:MAG: hypothetical protein P1U84_11985 [Parvibaculaceae bacterium]|nr:hypothetical protein [Parvibaculaceae bacterium]
MAMRKTGLFSLAGVFLLGSGAGLAAEDSPPRYDVPGHCEQVASFGGAPSEMIRSGCLQQEQQAYNDVKRKWSALPGSVRSHCDEVARFGGGGSYMILKGCIDQELASQQSNDDFEFKY